MLTEKQYQEISDVLTEYCLYSLDVVHGKYGLVEINRTNKTKKVISNTISYVLGELERYVEK